MSGNSTLGIPFDYNDTLILRLFHVVYITFHHDELQLDRPHGAALVTSVAIGVKDDESLSPKETQALKSWAIVKFGKIEVEIV